MLKICRNIYIKAKRYFAPPPPPHPKTRQCGTKDGLNLAIKKDLLRVSVRSANLHIAVIE